MATPTYYYRISSITVVGGVATDLNLGDIITDAFYGTTTITSDIAPTAGVPADLDDASAFTEVTWSAAGGRPVLVLQTGGSATSITQTSGTVVSGQIASALVEQSTDQISWTLVSNQPWATAATPNTQAAATLFALDIGETINENIGAAEVLEDNLFFLDDIAAAVAESIDPQTAAVIAHSDTVGTAETVAFQYGYLNTSSDSVAAADTFVNITLTMYLEVIGLSDSFTAGANTTSALTDQANLTDIIQQAINQIVADTAAGADTLNLSAALTLVDIANAVATQTSTYNSVMLVAELVATLEAFNGADSADIMETGVLSDAYAARVAALVALLESAQAIDTNTTLVHVMQSATDSAEGATAITSTGSLITALLADSALTTIRLNIGGELFTGWVLNTDTMAPSEYQFADRQFNSACKHGDTYLMAAEDGIYEFTEDTGVESVMTYIKTGKSDFGSDLKKRIVNSYIVYSATGNMVLKVTTSEYGQLQTRNYKMVPPSNSETTDVRRFDLGRGIKSRYWQFELVGDGVDCDIDEIGMLPIVLSRRI